MSTQSCCAAQHLQTPRPCVCIMNALCDASNQSCLSPDPQWHRHRSKNSFWRSAEQASAEAIASSVAQASNDNAEAESSTSAKALSKTIANALASVNVSESSVGD